MRTELLYHDPNMGSTCDKQVPEKLFVKKRLKDSPKCEPFTSLLHHPTVGLSALLSVLQVAGSHLTGQHVADDARGHEARNFRCVIGR